jgi:hypothetical protein
MDANDTRQAVFRLAHEHPDWLPVLRAACTQARQTERTCGEFAGRWVLQELAKETGHAEWRPGLRLLSSYGLIEKTDSADGGRRAYYGMPNRESVEQALADLELLGEMPMAGFTDKLGAQVADMAKIPIAGIAEQLGAQVADMAKIPIAGIAEQVNANLAQLYKLPFTGLAEQVNANLAQLYKLPIAGWSEQVNANLAQLYKLPIAGWSEQLNADLAQFYKLPFTGLAEQVNANLAQLASLRITDLAGQLTTAIQVSSDVAANATSGESLTDHSADGLPGKVTPELVTAIARLVIVLALLQYLIHLVLVAASTAGVSAEHATVALAAIAVHLYDQNHAFLGDSAHFVKFVGSLLGVVAFVQSRKSTGRILAAVEHLDADRQRDGRFEPTPASLDPPGQVD